MRTAAQLARRLAVGTATVAMVAAGWAALATAASPPGGGKKTVATGHAGGKTWTLKASIAYQDAREVKTCIDFIVGSLLHSGCPSMITRLEQGMPQAFPHGLAISASRRCPTSFFYGPVVGSARKVTIKLSSGAAIRTSAIRSPAGLPKSVRWVVATLPCDRWPPRARPVSFVARDAAGRTVGYWNAHSGVGVPTPGGSG